MASSEKVQPSRSSILLQFASSDVAHFRSDQTHLRPIPERVWDLSDFVYLIYDLPELILGNVARYFDFIPDLT